MAPGLPTGEQDSIGALVADIVHDGQKLVRQEILLARTELQHEWEKVKGASALFAAGAVTAGLAGFCLLIALVLALQAITGLPLWACFGIFAIALGTSGAVLLLRGKTRAKEVDFVPRQSMESVKENVKWFRNRI